MKTPDWYLVDGEWTDNLDDVPIAECNERNCRAEVVEGYDYCAAHIEDFDIAQARMTAHFIDKVFG